MISIILIGVTNGNTAGVLKEGQDDKSEDEQQEREEDKSLPMKH